MCSPTGPSQSLSAVKLFPALPPLPFGHNAQSEPSQEGTLNMPQLDGKTEACGVVRAHHIPNFCWATHPSGSHPLPDHQLKKLKNIYKIK